MALPRGDVAGAEEQREERHQRAEDEAHGRRRWRVAQDADALGDGANLQRQVGEVPGEHEERHQHARAVALEAEGEEVRQRGQLVLAGETEHGLPDDGYQEAGQRHADVNGEEVEALGTCVADAPGVTPGGGVHPEGECVGEGMTDEFGRNPAPLGGVGHQEEEEQVANGNREELSELEHGRSPGGIQSVRRFTTAPRTMTRAHRPKGQSQPCCPFAHQSRAPDANARTPSAKTHSAGSATCGRGSGREDMAGLPPAAFLGRSATAGEWRGQASVAQRAIGSPRASGRRLA